MSVFTVPLPFNFACISKLELGDRFPIIHLSLCLISVVTREKKKLRSFFIYFTTIVIQIIHATSFRRSNWQRLSGVCGLTVDEEHGTERETICSFC